MSASEPKTATATPAPMHANADPHIAHPSVEERAALGKAARRVVPRSSHAAWDPGPQRPDPTALLKAQEATRVPELLGIRHERMLESAFAFYRGAAVIMASDLSSMSDSGLKVQCVGDAHLANFGGFASPDRTLIFDINDFDETNPGPFEWDVKRLAASFEIAARSREFSAKTARALALRSARAYREAMAEFTAASNLDTWYARLDIASMIDRWRKEVSVNDVTRFEQMMAKARSKDSTKALGKLAHKVDGEFRIISDPPLVVPLDELAAETGVSLDLDQLRTWLHERFHTYRRSLQHDRRHLLETYELIDFARKVVGVGSVGTRCWIALLMGKDDADPLFLQIKEVEPSVLEPYAGKSQYASHGQRVVEGQRLLQASSDILLGWIRALGLDGVERDFYVRQLWDWKVSANLETMTPEIMKVYAEMCGRTLARGHARSGDRVAISSYLGSSDTFDRAIADFAAKYADQNQRDYEVVGASLRTS